MARHHSRIALGDQPGRLGPGRRIVAGRVGAATHRCLLEGTIHPQQGGPRGDGGDQHHEDHQQAEGEQPAVGVVAEEVTDPGQEGEQPEQQDGDERDGDQPQLADDLAVEEARAHEVGDVAVEPLHPFEQGPLGLARLQLGHQVADDVMAEGGVHGRPRVLEPVVRIGLVAVDHVHPLDAFARPDQEVTGQGRPPHPQAGGEDVDRVAVPGQLAVVVARQQDHLVVGSGARNGPPPR